MNDINKLLTWINIHDTGVEPCGIVEGDKIVIRVAAIGPEGQESIIEERVFSYKEARIALGY